MLINMIFGIMAFVLCVIDVIAAIEWFKKDDHKRGAIYVVLAITMFVICVGHVVTIVDGSWDIHFHLNHNNTKVIK